MKQITPFAISVLKKIQYGINQEIVVEVTKIKKVKKNIYAFMVSDGAEKMKAIIEANCPKKDIMKMHEQSKNSQNGRFLLQISQHMTTY